MEIADFAKENSTFEKLLGVHFEDRLTFDYHISEVCKKTSKKINALTRVSQYINKSQSINSQSIHQNKSESIHQKQKPE